MAEKFKYTAKPWTIVENSQYGFQILAGEDETIIARVHDLEDHGEAICNAKLIASAPELYEVLNGLLKVAKKQLTVVEDEPAKLALGFIRDEIKDSLNKLK